MPNASFKRGLTVCDVQPSADGWALIAYVSVDKEHPYCWRRFVTLKCGHTLTHVAHKTGDPSDDARWWFVVNNEWCALEDVIMRNLAEASDELTHDPCR